VSSGHSFNLEADAYNRERALELTSFIVEAPAGAGKTELLTQRYLRLLQTVNEPEEIIAITFTNKAAAEMRLRILDSLMKAATRDKPAQPHKQITYDLSLKALERSAGQDWQLIENPSRLRIFTIDSLCAHLARQMPLMSRFGSQPRVAVDATALYAQAAEQTLALLEDSAHGEVVKAALRYVDNNAGQLNNLLITMLEKRDQWLHHAQFEVDAAALQQTLRYMVEQEIQAVAAVFNTRFQAELMPLARFAASQLPGEHPVSMLADWDLPLPIDADGLQAWLAVCELVLTKDNRIRAKIDKNIGFPADKKDEKASFSALLESMASDAGIADALARIRALPTISDDYDAWQMIATLSQLLNLAVAQLWLVFQRSGEVDFVEIAQRATRALGDDSGEDFSQPSELALKLDYQIKHLLVDEFQDTSPSQVKLLEQLTLGWQVDDGRTLFAVGDPMQSIYRFRKANVGLFIDAAEHGIGDIYLERLQLYRNNRSSPAIVEWINRTFAPIFPEHDEVMQGAIHYRPFIATRDNLPQAGVAVHPVIKQPDESAEQAQQREAEAIVRVIQAERLANPEVKIAVLVRSKKHLASLVSKLRREHKDIAFQAVEIEALEGRQVVQDLLALTHALHHRADRVHWLAILRAPWCGLNLHDMHALAGHDHASTIWALMHDNENVSRLSADGQARLKHVREILDEAYASQGRMHVSRWIRGVWLMLNGSSCLWEPSDVVDVQAFFSCLDALDRSNQFSPERMEFEITKLFAVPDSHGENLQMMTIHKSKGLEFDTVILPGLGASTGGNNGDKPLVLWEEVSVGQQQELLAAPYIPKGARDKETVSPYDYLEAREKERDANESARVLYVAATRVERKLHLVGVANQNAKGEISPTKNTSLDLLWPTIGPEFEAAVATTEVILEEIPDIADFTPGLVRLQQAHLPSVLQTAEPVISTNKPNNKPAASSANIDADVGTLAHRYMEIIAQQGLAAWPVSRVSALLPAMHHWLRQQGHAESLAHTAAAKVEQLLISTLNSAEGQWVLQSREGAAVELALMKLTGDGAKKHIVDRTFIDSGTRWIIDYKTTELSASASIEDMQSAAESHRKQLENYAALFADEGLPLKCAIFFMHIGKLVLLP
jgi:ATP-dependent exoDNAse (exonuclease V) beta subunit